MTMCKILLIAIIVFLLPVVTSIQINEYGTEFTLLDDESAIVKHDILLLDSNNTYYETLIPKDSYNLSVSSSGKSTEFFLVEKGERQVLRFKITTLTEEITIVYSTKSFITQTTDLAIFGTTIFVPYNSIIFKMKVILPERAILTKPSEEFATSIYPLGQVSSDGQHITVTWTEYEAIGDFSYMVVYKLSPKEGMPLRWFIVGGIAVLLLIGSGIYIFHLRKKKHEIVKETRVVKEKEIIVPNLKERESRVVEALKLKEGSAEQGTLRVMLDMPKATLSVILKELEERKVIYKEKRGNKNMVFLKEATLNVPEQVTGKKEEELAK